MTLPTLIKQPWEDKLYDLVFNETDFRPTEVIVTISSLVSTSYGLRGGSTNVTISEITHDDNHTAQGRISGGTDLEDYKITVKVITDQDNYLEGDCLLQVRDY